MKTKKTLLLTLLLVSALVLSACGSTAQPAPAPEAAAPAEAAAEPEAAPAEEAPAEEAPAEEAAPAPAADAALPVRVITLNGTTGFGMAGLIAAHEAGETALNYTFTVETDASNATAALVSGDCDLAALPTNAASALYNKTGGTVQVLALNTRGVLYLVSDGSVPVTAFSDLEGQTVFAPAQNPSFIFRALCEANGVNVTVDNTYAQPAELNTAAAAGEVALAVLPEPLLTVARSQNQDLQVCLSMYQNLERIENRARALCMRLPDESQIRVVSLPGLAEDISTQTAENTAAETSMR